MVKKVKKIKNLKRDPMKKFDLYLTDLTLQEAKELAKKKNMSASAFLRLCIEKQCDREFEEEYDRKTFKPELISNDISGIKVLCDQILERINLILTK